MKNKYEYDVFISYAYEDESIAKEISNRLSKLGLSVWFDQHKLKVGDSLYEEIGKAIKKSKFGVVILSKNYLSKKWPVEELKTLFQLQLASGQKIIIPLWHGVGKEEMEEKAPFLMDIRALSTNRMNLDDIAHEICGVVETIRGGEEIQMQIVTDSTKILFNPPPDTEKYLVKTLKAIKLKRSLKRTI